MMPPIDVITISGWVASLIYGTIKYGAIVLLGIFIGIIIAGNYYSDVLVRNFGINNMQYKYTYEQCMNLKELPKVYQRMQKSGIER